ncbi:MAG: alpha-glucosidase/alpha-galactosidase [Candidatus Bathyarchaeota archaeon]|nr:MAG: alpha-glucosidase/alpha-galactosidase [Candidatus Bathyarchaeota archaeon]
MVQIALIGAGSIVFSSKLIADLCLTQGLHGSKVTLMDINKERLNMVYHFATRYMDATHANFLLKTTLDRKEALRDADFVISSVKIGGYASMEKERKIAEDYGYYRGIGDRVSDYYGGIGAYHQLNFFLDLARDMENLCPTAWLIETANPVFEGTTLISRETKIKTIGVCHGHFGYERIVHQLRLNPEDVRVQIAGFNHCIWMTRFSYNGKNAYPLLDNWIEKEATTYWKNIQFLKSLPWESEQLSPSAVDMYTLYELFPIGDTVRSVSPWWHHVDLQTKQKWYGPTGGFDSEIGWSMYMKMREEEYKTMSEVATNESVPLTKGFPPALSSEQHIPIIDAIVNDKERLLQLNVPNEGTISGIPRDVAVEIPVVVNRRGIQRLPVDNFPKRLLYNIIIPRMRRMEQVLHAFLEGERQSLLLLLMEDPRTDSYEQATVLLDKLLSQSWNSEAANCYK